jgi:hypothetical protein
MEKKFKEIQNHDTKSFHLFFFLTFVTICIQKYIQNYKNKRYSQMMEKKFKEIQNRVFAIFQGSASLLNGTMFG